MPDNYLTPDMKAKWGFGGSASNIIVAPEKATDAEAITGVRDPGEGVKNGGGKLSAAKSKAE